MLMYYAKYTDTGLNTKTVSRLTIGTGQDLLFTIYDENGDVVDLSSVTTNMKIYVGVEGTLKIDGRTLSAVDASVGTFKYPLIAADFAEVDVGTHNIELQFANNATIGSSTSTVRAGDLELTVEDSISD